MMMLVHDVGCGVKSLTRPLTFLLINLGTASEILSLILSADLIYVMWPWKSLEYSISGVVLRTCIFNLAD